MDGEERVGILCREIDIKFDLVSFEVKRSFITDWIQTITQILTDPDGRKQIQEQYNKSKLYVLAYSGDELYLVYSMCDTKDEAKEEWEKWVYNALAYFLIRFIFTGKEIPMVDREEIIRMSHTAQENQEHLAGVINRLARGIRK